MSRGSTQKKNRIRAHRIASECRDIARSDGANYRLVFWWCTQRESGANDVLSDGTKTSDVRRKDS